MSNTQQQQDDRPILKRPRPVISCLACRKKKLKCDRLLPCQQCIKGGRAQTCEYATGQEPELREHAQTVTSPVVQQVPAFQFQGSKSGERPESRHVDDLLDRLRTLEHALQQRQSASQHGSPAGQRLPSSRNSQMDIEDQDTASEDFIPEEQDEQPLLTRFQHAQGFIASLPNRDHDTTLQENAIQVRMISEVATTIRRSSPARYASNRDVLSHMLRLLPTRTVCEQLITLYFENFEHCSRILHRPMFVEQTNAFFNSHLEERQRGGYIPTLIGVLSIAASLNTLPECDLPELHGKFDGIGAVQLMDCWLNNIPFEEQHDLSVFQVRLLSLQPQTSRSSDYDELWVRSGQTIRHAMLIGLHQKATWVNNHVETQLRRWLWVTALEQDLALSIACGMPPNCSSVTVIPPENVNDEDLHHMANTTPPVYSKENWTDSLCQHVLAQSFNARARAYELQFRSGSRVRYSEVMDHAKNLEQVLRELPAPFKLNHNNPPGRLMAQMEFDITLRRPLIALYEPFGRILPPDDAYKEARIAWVQSSLVVLCFQDLFDPKYPVVDVPQPEGYWDFYYTVYKHDVRSGLHVELLELQRLKYSKPDSAAMKADLGLQQHAARSHTRALGWTVDGMTKSVEDTLDPLVRRIGREGADLMDVVLCTIIFDSLCARDCDDLDAFIRLGLNQLLTVLRSRLEREGYKIQQAVESFKTSSSGKVHLQWLSKFLHDDYAS